MQTTRALVIGNGDLSELGILAEWGVARGMSFEWSKRGTFKLGDPRSFGFIVSLGSAWSVYDERYAAAIDAERDFLCSAVANEIPVLGICFGGQLLASAMGGSVHRADRPELAWGEVESTDLRRVPTGPWLNWHHDAFTIPPGAALLATNEVCNQAFSVGRSMGLQFHAEATADVVSTWVREAASDLAEADLDGVALLQETRLRVQQIRAEAWTLFDAFWRCNV